MNPTYCKTTQRGWASWQLLASAGFLLIFVLAFILALQTGGLLSAVWRSATVDQTPNSSMDAPSGSQMLRCTGTSPQADQKTKQSRTAAANRGTSTVWALDCQSPTGGTNAPKASEPAPTANTADTLSALGVVVALVTLVLTIGSTYLTQKQHELELLLGKENQRQALEELLTRAQTEVLLYYLRVQPSAAAQEALRYGMFLRLLQSPDAAQRQQMNGKLGSPFGPTTIGEMPAMLLYLTELERYLQAHVLGKGELTHITFFREI